MSKYNWLLDGVWVNSYGSQMTLNVQDDGRICGQYASTTGASGTYWIVGCCLPYDPHRKAGQPLVLSIYWKPIPQPGNQLENKSWHWVSTYCGQLSWIYDPASREQRLQLELINDLVATSDFDGYALGSYIDKLQFHFSQPRSLQPPQLTSEIQGVFEGQFEGIAQPSPINGTWKVPGEANSLFLSLLDGTNGAVKGLLGWAGEKIELWGFCDVLPLTSERQSLTVSGYSRAQARPISLSGYLDVPHGLLRLTRWQAMSTTPQDTYMQAMSSLSLWVKGE
ncbi:avidin/streptavidin family protein [Aliagarivorans marinus]|uniref:avidin/streptavidin family protein n=1 Tax=Aliagarivorans marinus TaxID=561965 RepID=UPI000418E125|nr:avidin/streptavidin family protein [Aliagarivorans marinus]